MGQHRALWRHHHVPRHRRAHDQGAHRPCPLHHEDQGGRPPRSENTVFGLVEVSSPVSPPSSRCGYLRPSMTNLAHLLCTASASKLFVFPYAEVEMLRLQCFRLVPSVPGTPAIIGLVNSNITP